LNSEPGKRLSAAKTTNIVFDGNTNILAGKRQQWSLSKDQVANNFADWQKLAITETES
jgi:hypothetical protein